MVRHPEGPDEVLLSLFRLRRNRSKARVKSPEAAVVRSFYSVLSGRFDTTHSKCCRAVGPKTRKN